MTLILVQCATRPQGSATFANDGPGVKSIDVNIWGVGTEIRNSGTHLMDNPMGFLELTDGEAVNDSVLVVVVHGYQSQGYEWITSLKNLATTYGSVYFFRYNWERCPDELSEDLALKIQTKMKSGSYKKLVVFGHSYGGLVVTYAASKLGKQKSELHVIAAPLSGFPQLMDECKSLEYDSGDKLIYPKWNNNVQLIQHKTVHAQDGAFRDLASNPQNIDLPYYRVQDLPPTMDGHRLGHNWSVT